MDTILQITDLSKKFSGAGGRDFYAVDHISFELRRGEILGIVGESGSGKSTAAKLITRLIDPTAGTIVLEGKDITKARGRELLPVYERMQMVFQNPVGSFDPRRKLGEGIGESLRNKGRTGKQLRSRIIELLELCGLREEFADRYPHEVSGGQCQRAAIARALANEPDILIFDEATSSLDVTVQKKIIELLQILQKERNLSYIFICHNLALVQQFCDRAAVMYDGKIVEQGTPDEVIMNPQSEYTKKLVAAVF